MQKEMTHELTIERSCGAFRWAQRPAFMFKMLTGWCMVIVAVGLPAGGAAANEWNVTASAGPFLLTNSIYQQWGGHSFSYLLQDKNSLYYAGVYNEKKGKPWPNNAFIVGSYPLPAKPNSKPKSGRLPTSTVITDPNVEHFNQPQMFRDKLGYLHVMVGTTLPSGRHKIRYYRSANPNDLSSLVDRSSMIDDSEIADYHTRMNVGINMTGDRAVLVSLAWDTPGLMNNTLLVSVGTKVGNDFHFAAPRTYCMKMRSIFYPQVACTDYGVVIAGQIYDKATKEKDIVTSLLVQIDWGGTVVNRIDLPCPNVATGHFTTCDMRPIDPQDWSKLTIAQSIYSTEPGVTEGTEIYVYDAMTHELTRKNFLEGPENQGKLVVVDEHFSFFLNNPSQRNHCVWQGDILGGQKITHQPLAGGDIVAAGYPSCLYNYLPNVLTGSVVDLKNLYFATDVKNPNDEAYSLVAYKLEIRQRLGSE